MKATVRILLFLSLLCSSWRAAAAAPSIGQWDFDTGNLAASAGSTLGAITFNDGPGGATSAATQFGTTATFGIPAINGTNANVMKFPAASGSQGYLMPTPPNANSSGGSTVNDYTIIFDVLYPSTGLFKPLIQTDDGGDGTIAYFAVSKTDQVGATNNHTVLPSGFNGQIASNTWYRLGFVMNRTAGTLTVYINGVAAGVLNGVGGLDNPYTLLTATPTRILSNSDTNAAPGYVNSIQVRDVPLNAGQMQALGGPAASGIPITIPAVPSFIASRTPDLNATGIPPTPHLQVVIDQGDSTINVGTVSLAMDGSIVPAAVTGPAANRVTVDYNVPTILDPLSPHTLTLRYQDTAGFKTNTWSFTVANYQNVTLPTPIYLETFDTAAEGGLPTGWTATNNTVHQTAGLDLNAPKSDSYLGWIVISSNRLSTVFPFDDQRRLQLPPIVLNGVVLDRLVHGNLAYAESDQRQNDGGQVQVMFSGDYNLTGRSNVFVAWKSSYEQNQDNIASAEYSIDGGANWLPVLYCFDDGNSNPADDDIVRTNGVIDVNATFNTSRGDQAYGLPYSAFIGAPVSTNLIPYIGGRINDSPLDGKRIEIIRLPQADGKPAVRFRFCQAGTSSWYFGIDDFGLYSINTPVITVPPASQTIDAGTPVTFSVTAVGGGPLSYQWKFNGNNIAGATGSSYTIGSVSPSDAGNYTVTVTNPDGPTKSSPAQLTVTTLPSITTQPLSQVTDPGATITFSTSTRGGRPLTHLWYFNGSLLGSAANSNNLVLNNVQAGNAGTYQLVLTNVYGAVTSSVVKLAVTSTAITNCLLVHLGFDSNFTDTSGRGNNATYQTAGVNGDPLPTFAAGQIGQAFQFTTLQDGTKFNYATLGYPNDLKFGASNDFSISMWVNYNNQIDDPPFISNKDWASSDNPGWGIFTQGGPNFRVNITGPTSANKMSTTATPPIRDGTWHNIIVSAIRGGLVYIYVDGSLVTTSPLLVQGSIDTDTIVNRRINIGQDGRGDYTDGGGAQIVDAKIDDLGIWCRPLTSREAASIYAQGLSHNDLTTADGAQVTPPTIGSHPVPQTITAGGSVTFNVTAAGAGLSYRWRKGGVNTSGTAAAFTINPAQVGDTGDYDVVVSNAGGSVTSKVARLVVVNASLCTALVAHLTFDNDLNDYSGHANNATYAKGGANASATPSFVAGKMGQAFQFTTMLDGSRFEYATFGYPADLKFDTNDFSVSFWVNYNNSLDDPPFLSNKNWDSSSNIGWGLFTQEGGNFRVNATGTPRGSGNRMDATLSQLVRNSAWHHIAASFWRGQNTYTYVDGTNANVAPLVITGSVDTDDQGYSINIGQDGRGTYTDGGSAQIVSCSIDDLGIWRRVLTPQDIASIYAAGQAGNGLPSVKLVNILNNGATVTLNWTGNCPSYKVQHKGSLSDTAWIDDTTTTGLSATVAKPVGNAFYRISAN